VCVCVCVCEEIEESCHASFRGVKNKKAGKDYQEEEFQINASIYIQIANVAHIFATASVTNYNEAKPPGIALETNQNP